MDDKRNKKRKHSRHIIMLLWFLGLTLCMGGTAAIGATNNELFELATPPAQADTWEADNAAIKRRSYVKVNFNLLNQNNASAADESGLILNLFADTQLTATKDRVETRSNDNYTWFGILEDVDYGFVVLSIVDGEMAGNVSYLGGFFQIRSVGEGYYAIYEIDQSVFPDEAEPLVPPADGLPQEALPAENPNDASLSAEDVESAADDGSIIEVLVVYTAAAASASSNIASEIQLAIDETNQSYINSGITHRVKLAARRQIAYTETGNSSTDLSRLRATSDGFMDVVHSWRDTYRADQVTLITESLDACGRGYVMTSLSSSFASDAFTVVARSCATGYYSFGHEIGHNMGAHHDCYVNDSTTFYNYKHGFVHIGSSQSTSWRTIMAYDDECEAQGWSGCQRIQYWSNPSVSYSGTATGTSGSGCQANNRLVLLNTDYTVSNFRSGQCNKYGYIERMTLYPGSTSYIYLRTNSTTNYYTYYRLSDTKLAKIAMKAIPGKTYTYISGSQSCFDTSVDYGGYPRHIILSP